VLTIFSINISLYNICSGIVVSPYSLIMDVFALCFNIIVTMGVCLNRERLKGKIKEMERLREANWVIHEQRMRMAAISGEVAALRIQIEDINRVKNVPNKQEPPKEEEVVGKKTENAMEDLEV